MVTLPAAGAEVTPRGFSIELRPQHDFSVVSGIPQPDGAADPTMRVYSLATKEVEQFHMQAGGIAPRVYRWKVLLDIFVDGKAREVVGRDDLSLGDREEDLYLVESGCVNRGVHHDRVGEAHSHDRRTAKVATPLLCAFRAEAPKPRLQHPQR